MTPLLSSALLRAQSDERLVALAASGHDRAFEAIVERYRRPLLRYLRRLLSDTLAEDVVQATFINAWSSLRTGTEVRDLRPWLYRIAHNAAINALKKVGEAMEEVPESAGGFATEPAAELERRAEIQQALESIAALPSRQRAALLAVAVDGRAHSDVAEELGLTDGAVRQLVHRARTTLRHGATALTPLPLIHAMVASAGDSTVARVAEVAAGAGGAGAASLSLKAGAAAVLATGALVTGGPKVAQVVHPSSDPARTTAAVQRAAASHRVSSTPAPAPAATGPATPASPSGGSGSGSGGSGSGSGSASTSSDHRSGRTHSQRRHRRKGSDGGGDSGKTAVPAATEDRSGPSSGSGRSGGEDNSGRGNSGSGSDSGSGSGRSGEGGGGVQGGEGQGGSRGGRSETSGSGSGSGSGEHKGKSSTSGKARKKSRKGKGGADAGGGEKHGGTTGTGDDNLVVSPPSAPEPTDDGGGGTPTQSVPTTTPTTPPTTTVPTTTTPPPPPEPGSTSSIPGSGG